MKLRIKGDTLRLRLNRTELDQLAATGAVEDCIQFAPTQQLIYRIRAAAPGTALSATFNHDAITLSVPSTDIKTWQATDQVGLYASQDLGNSRHLEITLEKDFDCLHRDPQLRDKAAFPNPAATLK
ncbi:MAG TPA: hypothetical protein VM008_13220 [Phycisphaerae bacterium]|nr:hypothetical protein [Phycisphaerae bacterium]